MDGVAHRLLPAAQVLGDPRDFVPPRTRQEHLAAAQSESGFGAQSGFKDLALLFRQRTYEDGRFHGSYHNSQPETYPGDALGYDQDGVGPRGAHIRLSAFDPGDPRVHDYRWDIEGLNTEGNVIEENVLDDGGVVASFGVRAVTNWKSPKQDGGFVRFVRNNKVQNNRFYGFYWNAVELGGPATRANTVFNNKFYNTRQTPLDADKGAKVNRFAQNLVVGVSQDPGNGISAGIRDQGRFATCVPGDTAPQRYAEGNAFVGNTIRNVSASRRGWAAAGAALS